MTVAEPLQSKLVSMGMLSPQPNQESLPLGPEMQVASHHFLARCSHAFWCPENINVQFSNYKNVEEIYNNFSWKGNDLINSDGM